MKTAGDIFAADIMYHSNCMSSYLLAFERELSRINEMVDDIDSSSVDLITSAVDDLCSTLQLSIRGYSLSECRDMINIKFEESDKGITISNRQLKKLLIQNFGEKICFS